MQVRVCLTCKCGEWVRGVPRSLLEEGLSSSPFPGNFTGKIEHGTHSLARSNVSSLPLFAQTRKTSFHFSSLCCQKVSLSGAGWRGRVSLHVHTALVSFPIPLITLGV